MSELCKCAVPYIGTQVIGTPTRCERCGDLVPEALVQRIERRRLSVGLGSEIRQLIERMSRAEAELKYASDANGKLGRDLAEAYAQIDRLKAQVEARNAQFTKLRNPVIYVGTSYATAKVPERCPDCDGLDFISYGPTGMICKSCWLTSELSKAEAHVEALSKPVSDEEKERLSVSRPGVALHSINDLIAARAHQRSK